jgi:hypothetical protein
MCSADLKTKIMDKEQKKRIKEKFTKAGSEALHIADVSGSVFPCFTEGGEIFGIAQSHSEAVRMAKDRYGEDIPDEMLEAIIDEWEFGRHYR